ncbi:MAG: radical SAM protein [Ruminococcus sp.]|nr:radical SAM protein [Ruminococcus sp.]
MWNKTICYIVEWDEFMIEYFPWSKKILEESISSYKNGMLPILDLELGGCCNLNCIYCDSPNRFKKFTSMNKVKEFIQSGHFTWIFICGLGEPTFAENKAYLLDILELCKKHGVKCSMFTNLLDFDDKLFDYVIDDVLYVMFKLDSFEEEKIKKLYGNQKINFEQLQDNIQRLIQMTKENDGYTNVCASIVPTTLNFDELPKIISFCDRNNIFPLIGDLENSGKGQDVYLELKLSDDQLNKVKHLFNEDYAIPICPSVLCGIHILHDGTVALDQSTGLSCHWFWLTEPCVYKMKNIFEFSSYNEITDEIISYRYKRIPEVKKIVGGLDNLVFGGCGGDIKTLLEEYIKLHCL